MFTETFHPQTQRKINTSASCVRKSSIWDILQKKKKKKNRLEKLSSFYRFGFPSS